MFFFIKFKRKGNVNEKNGRSQNRAAASGSRAYESFYIDRTHHRNFNHSDFSRFAAAGIEQGTGNRADNRMRVPVFQYGKSCHHVSE